jgi:hypothetical protein
MNIVLQVIGMLALFGAGLQEYRKAGMSLWAAVAFVDSACWAGALAIQL